MTRRWSGLRECVLGVVVLACGVLIAPTNLVAQFGSPGARSSFVAVVSPAVVASWRTFDNHAGVTTSLLVLWRGTPGWFGGAIAPSASNSGSTNQGFTYADREFRIDYDDGAGTATVLKRQFSLKEVNVVLVDGVDSATGPAIVASKRVAPGPPAPPLVPGAIGDPVAGIVIQARELYDFLRCDLTVSDPRMNAIMPTLCGRMRGELVLPSGYPR
jgi:hypothetical protein